MRPFFPVILPLILVASCSAPQGAPVRLVIPPPPPSDEADFMIDPTIASVIAARAPEHLALDGDLAEWGSLSPSDAPPPQSGKAAKEPRKSPPPPDPNPPNAPSRVAVAITGDGARIAADLGELAREGVWVGIGAQPSEVPPTGLYTQVDGSVNEPVMGVQMQGCAAPPGSSEPFDPDTDPKCLESRRERDEVEAAHDRRFQRFFRIDRKGVSVAKDDGTIALVEGAQVAWKPRAKGATAEVSLPALALPRMSEAPLARLELVARAATTQKLPELSPEEWIEVELPAPVAFEPLAELRARAFKASSWMSYQPGDPLHVESMRYASFKDRSEYITKEEPLYVKQAKVGDAEVGYLAIAPRIEQGASDRVMLAILRKNGEISTIELSATPRAFIERDNELHVLCYEEHEQVYFVIGSDTAGSASFGDATLATWTAVLIDAYGMHKEHSFDAANYAWDSVDAFHDGDSFGLRGFIAAWATPSGKEGQVEEFRWQWSAKQKEYALKRRSNAPARKKAKSAK